MVRHVALFRWKEGTSPEAIAAVGDAVGGLPAAIPGVRAYAFGPDLGLIDGTFDFAVVADFDDEDAYRTYAHHAAHEEVSARFIRPITTDLVRVQYEI